MTQHPIDLPSLTTGTRVQDTLLVLEVSTRATEEGQPYTILTLGNATGEIATAPFWLEQQDQVAGVRRGHAVQVIGDVVPYRERRQLKVVSLRVLPPGTVNPSTLLPSVGPVERYWETLDQWRSEIRKPRLARVIALFYEDQEFRAQYEQCPASIRGHHAQLGGLLKHTVEVAAIARTVARACGADLDLVVAGTLLHDIGKLKSYAWDGVFEFTDAGVLLGHVVLGALMLDQRISSVTPPVCSEIERDLLLHILLAHHGRLEFGSPVQPMTLEAEVIHWADNASAKTASLADALRDARQVTPGTISAPVLSMDRRRLYLGSGAWGATDSGLQPHSHPPGDTRGPGQGA